MGGSYYSFPCTILSTRKDRKTPQRYPDVPTTSWRISIKSMDSFQGLTTKFPRHGIDRWLQIQTFYDHVSFHLKLLKELTTNKAPKKVLIREEAKFLVTKNVNSISLTRGEEERSEKTNVTTRDDFEKPTKTETKMPVKEDERIKKLRTSQTEKLERKKQPRRLALNPKAAVLYEYETFKATEGELLLDIYIQYLQVINDLKKCGYSKDNSLIAKKTKVSKRKEKVVVSSDSQGSDADDFSELKKITALFAKAFNRRKFYSKPTNNNLRTSSASKSANKKKEYASSSSANDKISELSYYLSESKSESEYEISEYYDNTTTYGLFVNDNNDQEIFHDCENFPENLIQSQIDHNESAVDHNNSKGIDKLTLYDERVIDLRYTLMFLTHSDEALEIEKFKRARENKIEFAYDYGNLNASYVNEKINLSNDYFQEIINPDFDKIDSPFQQTSSLKPYVPNAILEKIIIDLENEVVSLLDEEKENLKTIESLKSKDVEKDTLSSVRSPKPSGVMRMKKGSSNTVKAYLSSVNHSNLNKNVKHYSRKNLMACNNFDTCSAFDCNNARNAFCNARMNASVDVNDLFVFDDIVQISLWIIDSDCSKHMTGNRALLINFVEKFLGTVRFGNNDFVVIAGNGDVVIGSMMIKKVYYVKGLGHKLFSVGQLCDKGLEVAFRKSSCFVRNEHGEDLFTGDCSSNLYTIDLNEIAPNSSNCLLAKASYLQSWLWHQHLFHLNFATINNLVKNNLVQEESSSSSLNDDVQQSLEEVIQPQTNTQSISNNMVSNVDEASTSHNVFNKCLEDAYFDASTSFHDPSNVHTVYQPYPHEKKWTKDYPLYKIIGDPKSSVYTREEVYVGQPLGFVSTQYLDHVYALDKALYGLKQAPRTWYDVLSQFLIKSGFQKGSIDTTVFIKKKGKHIMLIQIYVDDIIFGSTNLKYCTKSLDLMVKRFEMSMMGEMKFFLGLQVNQFSNGIFINQSKYILDILKRFRMENCDTVPTPMVEQAKLKLDLVGKPVDHTIYRSMIGSLMYVTSTRPEIMFATCKSGKS
nr:hypothetical protein [Tanacetum cinerariifolium]